MNNHEPNEKPAAEPLPKAYDPSIIEQRWADYWVRERIFEVLEPNATASGNSGDAFTVLLPPPNVTGRLHMGHMLNQTEIDILIRWRRMSGDTALWVPGTDHAGIATQMMVERQLAAEGTCRKALGREAFTTRVWEWKEQYGSAITDQMKRLGASVDWSREYFTMDPRLSRAVIEAFVRLYQQGLIYRGSYIVNWDPIQQTAVSDLEVESEERIGKLYSIRYPFAGAAAPYDATNSIAIATTRPETMLGDVAVAVNPHDDRYQHLIGSRLQLPLSGVSGGPAREIPLLADDWAKPEFGTGAVKVTPAHDPNDFAIGQRHALPSLNILDETAHIDLPGSPFHGLDRFEARKQILVELEALGLLVAVKDHPMTVPISQRSGAVIEPRLSLQWFLAVNKPVTPDLSSRPEAEPGAPHLDSEMWDGAPPHPAPTPNLSSRPEAERSEDAGERSATPAAPRPSIAQTAINAVRDGHITFTPEMYSKTYFEWMSNIHDWCISRQLWWGHRIPAWHCAACSAITVARDTPTACATCSSTDITQSTDVLDTWFSSGLLPFTVFGWPGEQGLGLRALGSEGTGPLDPKPWALPPDLQAFYPTSLLITGFDILFFWVARMIMLGCHFMLDVPMPDGAGGTRPRTLAEAVPFKAVYIHALVRDANREKMSKTKGNVIDPIGIVEKYGTDAVRFTLASMASPGTDIAFSEPRTEGNRAFANKIWNAARFLFMNLDRAKEAGYALAATTPGAPGLASETWVLGPQTPLETRWIYSRLSKVSAEVQRALNDYRFDEAANAIYQFFWGEFCDWYLELVKLRLDSELPKNDITALTLASLVHVFESALRLLSPFMPFLTEEIWHALYAGAPPAKSIALTRYPQASDYPADPTSVSAMQTLQELITTVRGLRKELGVPEKEPTPITLHATNRILALADANADMLSRMARVASVEFASEPLTGNNSRSTANFDVAITYERQIDIPAERERLTKDLAKYEKGLVASDRQLGNEFFMAKAPAHIVEGLRKQAAETRTLYDKTKAALDALG